MKKKLCNSCKEEKDISEFSPSGKYYHCKCKKCRSEAVHFRHLEKKAERFPDHFIVCDNCDKLQSIFVLNKVNHTNGLRIKKTECHYCKSDEILRYGEA